MITFPETQNLADYCLFQRLEDDQGDLIALRFGDRTWTYADVASHSSALARWLVDEGFVPESRVYVVLRDVPPFAWSVFGTLAAGGILTMGNPDAPAEDLLHVLDYVKARVLVTTSSVASGLAAGFAKLPHLRTVLLVPDVATGDDPEGPCEVTEALHTAHVETLALSTAIAEGHQSERALPLVRRDDPAVWLFTSGSTGRPKAAMHTHRDFMFNTEVYAKRTVGYRAGDITVSVPRLFFGYATGTNLWFPFAVGATVGLFAERPTPESLAAAIAMYRPTIVTNVPTMLGKLLDHAGGVDLSSVRFHLSAGEALPPALLERFLARFGGAVYDGIGSAEMFHIYASNRPDDVKPGSLGRAVEGYQLRILPEDAIGPGAAEVPRGEIGILWVRGDSVSLGYYQDRDKSWSTFHGHWCRTGDLFRIDDDGYLWFAGRADDLFKVGGVFVSPVEVEECLGRHPAVSMAAVVPADDAGLTKPKAYVVLRPGAQASAEDLQEHCKAHLSKHKYPRWVVFVAELPRNDRGKIDRKALAERK